MATEILAAGTTEAASSTFTLAAGESATLQLKGAAGRATAPLQAHVVVEFQLSTGKWQHNVTLRGTEGSAVITGVGTFRCYRPAQNNAVGVEKG